MELFEDEPGGNAHDYTVSEIAGAVKRVIEGEFGRVRVRGEVGRVSRPGSGHLYFALKDDRSVLDAVIWKGTLGRLKLKPEEGMEVVATGRMTTFPGSSKYQLVVEEVALAGAGALMALLEKRRVALQAEGLFDPARKKRLPFLPGVIGVVTSPSGAVIRDILHRLRDRFPRQVVIWPVPVQGDRCATEVAAAIRGFNALAPGGVVPRPDVLIVARGGGSLEDLWGFNEEIVVRAAAQSAIPLISAVGHETDTTLIDFAADVRAPTPTAAAEMAVPVRADLQARVAELGARLARCLRVQGEGRRQRLRDLSRALPRPEALLAGPRQRLDLAGERLPSALRHRVAEARVRMARAALRPEALRALVVRRRERLAGLRLESELVRAVRQARRDFLPRAARLSVAPIALRAAKGREAVAGLSARLDRAQAGRLSELAARLRALDRLRLTLGYTSTLARGFAVVRAGGAVVTTRAAATGAGALEIEFRDGRLSLGEASVPERSRAPRKPPPGQGSLF